VKAAFVSGQSIASAMAVQPPETQNLGLWQQQLENASLWKTNLAITAFKSKNPFLAPNTQKSISYDASPIQSDLLTKREKGVESGPESTNTQRLVKLAQETADALHSKNARSLTTSNYGAINAQYTGKNSVSLNESHATTLSQRGQLTVSNELEWQKKHILISDLNGVKQVWIRDSAVTGTMTSKLASSILESMSQLGVELSRVSVNGQIVFQNNQEIKE